MKTLILVFLSYSVLAESGRYRDRELKKKDAPTFLTEALPQSGKIDDVEFFEKKYEDGKKTFELKYEENGSEISVTYSESGLFLEREQDIKFSSLSPEVQGKIKSYLESKFPGYSIKETERRMDTKKTDFIDVEIAHKKFRGYLEVSFTADGAYVSEETENAPAIETLN